MSVNGRLELPNGSAVRHAKSYVSCMISNKTGTEGQGSSDVALMRRQLLVATAAIWGAHFLILTARSILDAGEDWVALVPGRIAVTAAGIVLCYLMHVVFRRLQGSMSRQLMAALLMLPIVTELYAWTNAAIALGFYGVPLRPFDGETLLQLATILWLFATWAGFYLSLTYGFRLREEERRAHAERLLAKSAELQALRYQVNPHFLFNTLNSISALIADGRRGDAERMVESLSRFLRTTLKANDDEEVTLAEELALQQAYLEVEQVRFPDLHLSMTIADDAGTALVPSLILQPLVENAIKHGVCAREGHSAVLIEAGSDEIALRVKVSNDISPMQGSAAPGIGLANVERRLAARYGDEGRISTALREGRVFEVEIELPLKRSR